MSSETKRKLDELVTLYELEPDLSEVVTEGRVDAAIIRWFLRRAGSDTAVYCISDRIDVPAAEIRRQGLNVGAKGRVVTGALKVEEESTLVAQRVSFVYDVDDDVVAGKLMPSASCLLRTDYTSMEMYCFAPGPLDKMLRVTLRAPDGLDAATILEAISHVLVDVFFTRFILSRLAKPLAVVTAIEKKCTLSGNSLRCSVKDLLADSVGSAGGARALGVKLEDLIADQEREKSKCPTDIRLAVRGHDFMRICCYYLKSTHPELFKDDRLPYKTAEVFAGALITCLEMADLMSHELFTKLAARHANGTRSATGISLSP